MRAPLRSMWTKIVTLGAVTFLILFWSLWESDSATTNPVARPGLSRKRPLDAATSSLNRPRGIKIIGLVFYGRRGRAAILDCYLQRNLVSNGGWLDEVQWAANTNVPEDLSFLDEVIMPASPLYKKIAIDKRDWNSFWATVEPEPLYLKIDDDVVWMADDAVAEIVTTRLAYLSAFTISANVINSPKLSWVHYRAGAQHAYLPELSPSPSKAVSGSGTRSWRPSRLPPWSGAEDYTFPLVRKRDPLETLPVGARGGPPYSHHRWLPLPTSDREGVHRTPIKDIDYGHGGPSIWSWAIAAQSHYSLFQNLENSTTHLYKVSASEGTRLGGVWDCNYELLSINFIAIWGKDVLGNLPFAPSDEEDITVTLPKKLKRPVLVATNSLVAHYSFATQRELDETDILDRYRAYAAEEICIDQWA